MLCGSCRLGIAGAIGKTHNDVRLADVHILWIGTGRIERDAIGLLQARGEDLHLLRLSICGDTAKDANATGAGFGEEDVSVWRSANQARLSESRGVELDLESGRCFGPGVCGTRNKVGSIVGG